MQYKVELVSSEEGVAVSCLDLPGCSSQGDTEEEAISNIRKAIVKCVAMRRNKAALGDLRLVDVPDVAAAPDVLNGADRSAKFVVTPIMSGLPAEWTSHKVEDLLRILDETGKR